MIHEKNGNRRIDADSMVHDPASPDSEGISGAIAVEVGRVIRGTCRSFARAVDWQHHSRAASWPGDGDLHGVGTGYSLSEDHEGLHSGRYICVSVMRAANAVAIKGGYHDGYWQPRIVYRESVPLKEVTSQTLGRLLMEMHDRLCDGDRAQAT